MIPPVSFWVRNIEWDEDLILKFVSHLNFYMQYYDDLSPTILVHTPKAEASLTRRTRYVHDKFPNIIDSKPLDDVLLQLWEASHSGDSARRFLYCYRIVEYASFTYLENAVRKEIRAILSSPHALDDIRGVSDAVTEALQKSKMDDYPKFEAVLIDTVRPSLLWREINNNLAAFTSETVFDGGYKLAPLVPLGTTEAQYAVQGVANFSNAIRKIRNALSHGKDQKTAAVITPTSRTFRLLSPWASLLSVAVGEVILYKDVN